MPTYDLNAIGAALRALDDAMIRDLLAWRDNLVAATNAPGDCVVFLVPHGSLIGVSVIDGTPLIRADGIQEPMVAVAVPQLPL